MFFSTLLRFSGLTDACPTDRGFVYKAHVSLCFKYHEDKVTHTGCIDMCCRRHYLNKNWQWR